MESTAAVILRDLVCTRRGRTNKVIPLLEGCTRKKKMKKKKKKH
jgi:hypothetical protein